MDVVSDLSTWSDKITEGGINPHKSMFSGVVLDVANIFRLTKSILPILVQGNISEETPQVQEFRRELSQLSAIQNKSIKNESDREILKFARKVNHIVTSSLSKDHAVKRDSLK